MEVTGFRLYVADVASCPPGGSDVVARKKNLLVLNSPMTGGKGKAFDKREVPAGRVVQVAWVLE